MTLPETASDAGKPIALDAPIQSIGENKMSDLIERLQRLEPVYNGCAVPCGQEPVNPDGPEAADLIAGMVKVMEIAEIWLTGCLECKDFYWDGDQWQAATETRDEMRALIAKATP